MFGRHIIGGLWLGLNQVNDQRLFFRIALMAVVFRRVVRFLPAFDISFNDGGYSLSWASTRLSYADLPSPSLGFFFKASWILSATSGFRLWG
jgi:hypothetical protein